MTNNQISKYQQFFPTVGGFNPQPIRNNRIVKLGSSSLRFGLKIQNIFEKTTTQSVIVDEIIPI